MKQIISFEKEIPFKTMIGEVESIALEHTLTFQDDSSIQGDFIVSGTYKITKDTQTSLDFSYKVPVDIVLTTPLDDDREVEIDHFTYEILDEEALLVHIDLAVMGREKIDILEEDEVLKEQEKIIEKIETEKEEPMEDSHFAFQKDFVLDKEEGKKEVELFKEDTRKEKNEEKNKEETLKTISQEDTSKEVMHSIFSAFKDTEETFSTYSIYILRENDTLDEVLNRYGVTKEEISEYNQLDDLKVGSKLILPTVISNE